MDILSHLTRHYDKEANKLLREWVGNSQERFDEFMPFFLHDELRICQRAAWTFGNVCSENPELMLPWLPEILKALDEPKHDAIVRNVVRAFQEMKTFPDEYEGEIFERCFQYLADPNAPVAFRVFSMTVCRKIGLKYPELVNELIPVIEDAMIHGSAGMKSRGKKELKLLRKAIQ